jgi:predicted acetyltransferase
LPRTYRRARPEEHRPLVIQDAQAFGDSTASPSIDRSLARTAVEELRVLEDDGAVIGLLLARFHRIFWGGRPVPASQISGLSIGVQHRGRGAAGELLRGYLAEAHDRGAGIATLFPATVPLYRRAGYEYAGTWTLYQAAARNLPLDWPEGYHAAPGSAEDPAPLHERYMRVAPPRAGNVERDTDWWMHNLLADRGQGPPQVFLIDGPEGPDGWAILKLSEQVTSQAVTASVQVIDWGAATEEGWRSLLVLVAGFASLDAIVNWKGPEPEPLSLLLREQDVHQVRQQRWMLRVVNVPTAFSARGYPSRLRGGLTVRVHDEVCPWVDGTWSIEVEQGEGKASRVADEPAAASTTAGGLAAIFAGYIDPGDLATLGLVHGLTAKDIEFLEAMHAGPRPWSPDFY